MLPDPAMAIVQGIFPTFLCRTRVRIPSRVRAASVTHLLAAAGPKSAARITVDDARPDLHRDGALHPVFKLVARSLRRILYQELGHAPTVTRFYIGRCWPVIAGAEAGAGPMHVHAGATYSGVLYLQLPPGAGGIEFARPFMSAADYIYKARLRDETRIYHVVRPRTGDLLLFSSQLSHRALPNEGRTSMPRVAVAFDLFAMTSIDDLSGGIPKARHLMEISAR